MRRALAVLVAAALLTSACGTAERDEVSVAQAEVSRKQAALDEAQAAATEAEAEFCDASGRYVLALDRYGDVLSQTAPTVGDVVDAGADLTEPRDEVQASAEAVAGAREAVTVAEQELAQAQAELAAAEAAATGQSPAPAPATATPSAEPTAPPAGLTRVQQAEAEFAEARAGITDSTPLVQAAQQFNAAAVALEMAWLAALASSGCLTDDQQQQAAAAVAEYTVALQSDLTAAGYYQGEIDGVYGPQTVDAVRALQEANGLPQTGTVDKATEAALRSELTEAGGLAAQEAMVSTAALQQTLKLAGYWDGPIDGQWTEELTAALQDMQTDLGVEPSGTVDAATVAAFQRALAEAQQTPTPGAPTSSPPPSPSEAPAPPA